MMVLAVAAASCSSDDDEAPQDEAPQITLSPLDTKVYVEQVANEAIAMINPEDQREQLEFFSYFDRNFADYAFPDEWDLDVYSRWPVAAMAKAIRSGLSSKHYANFSRASQVWSYKLFTGTYEANTRTRRWEKVADGSNLVLKFKYNGQDAQIAAVPTNGTWTATVNGITVEAPQNLTVTATVGSTTMAAVQINSNFSETQHTLVLDADINVANIAVTSNTRGVDSQINETAAVTISGVGYVTANAVITGSNLMNVNELGKLYTEDRWGYKEINPTQVRLMLATGSANASVLNKLTFTGDCKELASLVLFDDKSFDSYDYNSKDAALLDCQSLCDYYNVLIATGVYVAGSSSPSASLLFGPAYDEWGYGQWAGWEYEIAMMLYFPQDGSTYAIDDYFESTGGLSLYDQLESLYDRYMNIWYGVR